MEVEASTSVNRARMSYDVFISFRGEDTRNTFVGFLYEALRQLGIMTFMDDKKLWIGDDLSDELLKAIQESRSSIVVLSKDYASSKWCLKELAKIIDAMGGTTHRLLPVFYHVDPSDVRHRSGSFQKSFDEHEKAADKFTGQQKDNYLQELQNWKESFTKIGNLSGAVVTEQSSEVDIVKKITNQIFDTWRPKLVTSNKNLVGMAYPLQQMNVRLGLGLDDIRFVGMVGMGGIGKTTIAKVVFDCIASKFEGSCFLRLYGGSSKQISLVSLQEQLLSRLFPKENIKIWDEDYGAEMIGNLLSGRKILLVLDGVEEKEQLDMLAGNPDWFGPGSRVIITTRNKQVLNQPYEIKDYNVKLLDVNDALQLFCNHAFGIQDIDQNFMNLSKEIVEKLGRLPLALKVIGSYLNKKNGVIWKETLNRLIKVDEKNFFQVLKISYDGLGTESQKVFLDLACFFNGKKTYKVIQILESFGYNPNSELLLFMERCLIEVSDTKILMHDMIVALGQEIVRQESSRQSRIWLQEDLVRAFTVKHGLKYIEGIVLSLEKKQKELTLEAKSFSRMTCLRILEISNVQLSGNINFLSNLLGLLNWPGYPSKCLPPNFHSAYLLELHLPHSSIIRLWEGKKEFEKLKVINVSGSKYLLETPDFSMVPNLESLDLCNCRSLSHIHPSINGLSHLSFLNIRECPSLKNFSSNLGCKNLTCLALSESGLTSFPEIEGSMEHLSKLCLDKTLIKTLHSSIKHLVGLVLLDLSNCTMLSSLPTEIGHLKSLEVLNLAGCVNFDQIPPSLGNIQCLKYLDISQTLISSLPSTVHCLKNLRKLNCDGLSHQIWLSLLCPCDTESYSEFSHSKFGLESLEYLSLKYCNLVEEDIPEDLHCFSKLSSLDLSGNNFMQLPESINHLTNLKELKLHDCFELKHVPKPPANLVPIISGTRSGTPITSFPIPYYQIDKHFAFEFIPKTNLKMDPKAYEESILKGAMFSAIDDAPQLLEAFDKAREGNSIEIEYSQITNDANNIYGVVLSACIQCSENSARDEVATFYSTFVIEFKMEDDPMTGVIPWTTQLTSRTRFWMLFIPIHMLPQSRLGFKIVAKGSRPSINVQMCGVHVLSHKNAPRFLETVLNTMYNIGNQKNFYITTRETNHESQCSCDEPETADQYSLNQYAENESKSFSLSKKNLASFLQRVYEEDKEFFRSYFFPRGEVSSWFRIQNPKDAVAVKLPLNLFREKKWMGLAVFATLSVHDQNSVFFEDYALNFQICSNDRDGSHWREGRPYASESYFIPLQLLQFSSQILFVSFVPRYAFPYIQNGLDHFYVNFITNAERLRVELCGARLVYQHNVEGLIRTISDYILKNEQEQYHDFTSLVLSDLLRDHQRIWPFRVPSDELTTSTSSDLDGHLSSEELIHESFQQPLFNIQELYQNPNFDAIFSGKEIPSFFTNQSWGNEVITRIPERLYFPKNEVQVLMCAVVTINRQIAKLERTFEPGSRRVLVLDLKCEFGVDFREVEPKHHIFVPAETLLSMHPSSFIWLSGIQFAAFDDLPWDCCNYLSCKISTNDEELFNVQQCGLHLLHTSERNLVDDLLMS